MKADIHPQYHPDATVKCACGNTWKTGSVKADLHVGICSNCHPFYTGKEKNLDARGQIERFKKRLEKTSARATLGTTKAPRKSNKK